MIIISLFDAVMRIRWLEFHVMESSKNNAPFIEIESWKQTDHAFYLGFKKQKEYLESE